MSEPAAVAFVSQLSTGGLVSRERGPTCGLPLGWWPAYPVAHTCLRSGLTVILITPGLSATRRRTVLGLKCQLADRGLAS